MLQRIKSQLNVTNFVIIGIIIVFFAMRIGTVNEASTVMISNDSESPVKSSTEVSEIKTDVTVLPTETGASEPEITTSEEVTSQGTTVVYNLELGRYVDIAEFNIMNQDQLMTFKGVGEVTSKAIMTHISTEGAMVCYEELLDIKGIGPKKLEKILSEKP